VKITQRRKFIMPVHTVLLWPRITRQCLRRQRRRWLMRWVTTLPLSMMMKLVHVLVTSRVESASCTLGQG